MLSPDTEPVQLADDTQVICRRFFEFDGNTIHVCSTTDENDGQKGQKGQKGRKRCVALRKKQRLEAGTRGLRWELEHRG